MNERPVRIVVFGYHTIGYRCLKELLDRGEEVCAVVTHQDNPHEHIWFKSMAELAQAAGVPVLSPNTPNTPAVISHLTTLQPDLLLSFYYRRLLCRALLSIPRLGAINLHGSLLPRYRGRAPVNWVLINGETHTGVTLHYMAEQADAGEIIAQRVVPIAFEDTALTLFEKVAEAAVELFRDTFPLIKAGPASRTPQDPAQVPPLVVEHRTTGGSTGADRLSGSITWSERSPRPIPGRSRPVVVRSCMSGVPVSSRIALVNEGYRSRLSGPRMGGVWSAPGKAICC